MMTGKKVMPMFVFQFRFCTSYEGNQILHSLSHKTEPDAAQRTPIFWQKKQGA
jgi:hypothetical protein